MKTIISLRLLVVHVNMSRLCDNQLKPYESLKKHFECSFPRKLQYASLGAAFSLGHNSSMNDIKTQAAPKWPILNTSLTLGLLTDVHFYTSNTFSFFQIFFLFWQFLIKIIKVENKFVGRMKRINSICI